MKVKFLRNFAFEAFLFGAGLIGVLSWTAEVELFRLGLPGLYEHMIVYGLLAMTLIAAKGLCAISMIEFSLIIKIAAATEALKYYVAFRHPKTSDFYTDILGFSFIVITFFIISKTTRLIGRVVTSTIRLIKSDHIAI